MNIQIPIEAIAITNRIPAYEPSQMGRVNSVPLLISDTTLSLPRPAPGVSRGFNVRGPTGVFQCMFARPRARCVLHVKELRVIVPDAGADCEEEPLPAAYF